MSHGDQIRKLPSGFHAIAHSDNTPFAAIEDPQKKDLWASVSSRGCPYPERDSISSEISSSIFADVRISGRCGLFWSRRSVTLRKRIGSGKVICALSGGVDSAVVALLLHRVIGDRLKCIFVNNGLLRRNEAVSGGRIFSTSF